NCFPYFLCFRLQYFNYLKTNDENRNYILANSIDCLVEYDAYGNIIPALAESWSYNSDMTQWIFQIRQGVQWVDYEGNSYAEVTADDWVATAEYINNAENNSDWQFIYSSDAVIHNAQEYYYYTDYVIKTKNKKKNEVKNKKNQTNHTTETDMTEDTTQETTEATNYNYYNYNYQDTTEATTEPTTQKPREYFPKDIGVEATDTYTLVYTLDKPCPYFLDILTNPAFMPVNRQFLKKSSSKFGKDNQNLLYNGAYILSDVQSNKNQILTKNQTYWDIANIHIDKIELTYQADSENNQQNDFLNQKIDAVKINADDLETWTSDAETKDLVHPAPLNNSCSYFYAFNFAPKFDSQYQPENWQLAVNNENFRHAIMSALNRIELISVSESYQPEKFLSNTITPKEFAFSAGIDYTQQDALNAITTNNSYNTSQAQEYRDLAREELTQNGAIFPIKILMPYDTDNSNQQQEYQLVKTQLEKTLGQDFVQVELQAIKNTENIRKNGKFAFMKCSTKADYIDPQTWTKPFTEGQNYIFWDLNQNYVIKEIFQNWQDKITEATASYNDQIRRYTAFAEAEQILIDHAIVIPFSIETNGYVVSRLTPFEAEYAPVGISSLKLKFCRLTSTSVSMDEYNRLYNQWYKPVYYTHIRANETSQDLVSRL
ncbi:MAG: hypothetical protein K2H93_07475, partial [Oscillospiraceae bacterium]|nr:hypothetical protein [Oscillospiraceae bacterium]